MKTGPRGAAVPIHRMDQKPLEEIMGGDNGSNQGCWEGGKAQILILKVWRLMTGFSKGHTSSKVNGDTTSQLFLCDQGCGHWPV